MVIEKNLFDECFCPCYGIARVCLNGMNGIPTELEELAKQLEDGEYMSSCFSIDVLIDTNDGNAIGGMICYSAENGFYELFPCDNYVEVWEYFRNNVDEKELKEVLDK